MYIKYKTMKLTLPNIPPTPNTSNLPKNLLTQCMVTCIKSNNNQKGLLGSPNPDVTKMCIEKCKKIKI